jgi:hypothetical protein
MSLNSQLPGRINFNLDALPSVQWKVSEVAEAFLATAIIALVYYLLQGQLPYHDAQRFTNQVGSGVFVWDIGHILLQPTAMLLHKWSGGEPVAMLKMLSSFATATAVGIFHLLLLKLEVPRGKAVLGTLILAGCCSVLTLAPSAHPKLVAFPFVTAAFLCLCMAERQNTPSTRLLASGGLLLALGAGFLASVLATAPFAALAVLFEARRNAMNWDVALRRATIVAAACGLGFLVIACAGYMLLTGESLSIAGLTGSVIGKADLRPAPIPLPVHLARVVFGTVNNLVAVPGLGATAQAWMRGQIPSLRPYSGLLPILALWLLAALLIAAIYLRTALMLFRHHCSFMSVAFLCGAQLWTIWYGLNDPEHWFLLTAPTIVLFLTTMPTTTVRVVLPAWTAIAIAANFALLAVPVATYPLATSEQKLASLLTSKDLLVHFVSYPGHPHVGFFVLPNVKTLAVDLKIKESGDVNSTLQAIDIEIKRTLQDGGRVLVADILDPLEWDAPWMALLGQGVTKRRLEQALLHSRAVEKLDDVGGIKLWELRAVRNNDS